jgi:pimeloyl-ACP methyl ester carboxylesterase
VGRSIYKTSASQQALNAYYDQQLAQFGMPYVSRMIDTRQGQTHVLCVGTQGPSVFLWHGMMLNALSWHQQIKQLAGEFRLFAVDMIGSAGKSASNRPSQKGTAYNDWALDVMNGLEIVQAHHVGISFGSWIILKIAQTAPEKIKSAVLMSAAGFTSPSASLSVLPIVVSMLFDPTERYVPKFLAYMSPPGRIPTEQEVGMFMNAFGHVKNDQVPGPLPDSALQKLTAPTLILIGEYERAFLAGKVFERAKTLLPTVTTEIVPDAGHGMTDENPALVNQKIADWIRKHN